MGDTVTPSPTKIAYPVLLDFPVPHLAAYPAETTIAEKFEVMLKRGMANSRMKDFYDIWWLAQHRDFEGNVLRSAIKATCELRGTPVILQIPALSIAFASDESKSAQWRAFRRRTAPSNCPDDIRDVVKVIGTFLEPIAESIVTNKEFSRVWTRTIGWN